MSATETQETELTDQEPYVQRMVEEQNELKDRLEKLNTFLKSKKFSELDDYNKSLLIRQREAMAVYFETLSARVALNKK